MVPPMFTLSTVAKAWEPPKCPLTGAYDVVPLCDGMPLDLQEEGHSDTGCPMGRAGGQHAEGQEPDTKDKYWKTQCM